MKLLVTADLHQWIPKWDDLVGVVHRERPSFVLIAGDLLPKGGDGDMFAGQRRYLKTLGRHLASMADDGAKVLLYFGNDDLHPLEKELDKLEKMGDCVNMNGRVYRREGLVFCGMNKVRDHPWAYKHWNVPDGNFVVSAGQRRETGVTVNSRGQWVEIPNLREHILSKPSIDDELEALRQKLKPGELERSIWLIHQPPAELGMDICSTGLQVGSPAVLKFARRHQPLFGCSGHIHESPYQPGGSWMRRVGRTLWIQPGQVGRELHHVTVTLDKLSPDEADEVKFKVGGCHHSVL
jgi:Icc-related predicted phosphoesterase